MYNFLKAARDRAMELCENGHYRTSHAFLLAAEFLGWRDAWSLAWRGWIRNAMGNEIKAKRLYRAALKLDPSSTMAREFMLRLLVEKREFREALSYASPPHLMKGVDANLLLWFAIYLREEMGPEVTLPYFQLAREGGEPWGWIYEAGSLSMLGREEDALAGFREAFERGAETFVRIEGRHGMAYSYYDLGRHDEALAAAHDALKLLRELPEGEEDEDEIENLTHKVEKTLQWLEAWEESEEEIEK